MTRPISSLARAYVFGSTLLMQLTAAEAQKEEEKPSSNLHLAAGVAFGSAALYLAYNVLSKKEEAPKIKQLDKVPRANQDVIVEGGSALAEDHDNENWSDVDEEDDNEEEPPVEIVETITPAITAAREVLKTTFKDLVVVRDELTGEIGLECLLQIR